MRNPRIAVPLFPGSNGEVDNLRTLRRCGFDAFVFRHNDSTEKLVDVDGYFFGAGFSYEDRGRSGMVAARDPLFRFIHEEARLGKVILGNCNGAQVLVESGLIPLGDGLRMCLAHNAIRDTSSGTSRGLGFLNEWVWMTPACARTRAATSDWVGPMHVPIAHGEGRFVTRDKDLLEELIKRDQIAFRYCDQQGVISDAFPVTPNGSTYAIAGICNPEGNVVAIMPHPERSTSCDAYFLSARTWIMKRGRVSAATRTPLTRSLVDLPVRQEREAEIFIETIITNNEERTVEQAARRLLPNLRLKQFRYVSMPQQMIALFLSNLSNFNPNKETAYCRLKGAIHLWNSDRSTLVPTRQALLSGTALLRRDDPDTTGASIGSGAESGVCYVCTGVEGADLQRSDVLEIFANPNASLLERLP